MYTLITLVTYINLGYNTRGQGKRKYFDGTFPDFKGQEMQSWLSTPESKAAAAAFLGTDYNTPLWGVTLNGGRLKLRNLVESRCALPTHKQKRKYLLQLERDNRFKPHGSTVCQPVLDLCITNLDAIMCDRLLLMYCVRHGRFRQQVLQAVGGRLTNCLCTTPWTK